MSFGTMVLEYAYAEDDQEVLETEEVIVPIKFEGPKELNDPRKLIDNREMLVQTGTDINV